MNAQITARGDNPESIKARAEEERVSRIAFEELLASGKYPVLTITANDRLNKLRQAYWFITKGFIRDLPKYKGIRKALKAIELLYHKNSRQISNA